MKTDVQKHAVWWLVLLAAAGTFALTMGTRQTMGFFLSPLNTATGLGVGSISLAFAFRPALVGTHAAVCRRRGRPHRRRARVARGSVAGGAGHFHHAAHDHHLGADPGHWRALCRWRRHGRAVGADGGHDAPHAGRAAWHGHRHRERGRLVWPVRDGAAGRRPHARPGLGRRHAGAGADRAAGVAGRLGAARAGTVTRGRGRTRAVSLPAGEAIRKALANPSYLLLSAGFFVCGFHVAFLATHLPGVVAACGLPAPVGAWALGIIGLFNIIGSLAMGWAVGRWRMKSLLSLVYATRAVAVLIFLLAPKTEAVMLTFAAVMGLTFLSTVPPTVGLVAKFFGTGNMAMLFGLVMLSHQIGGFLGAWLGGQVFEATGNYDWVWYIDIVLAVGAALIHLPIREAVVVRPQRA